MTRSPRGATSRWPPRIRDIHVMHVRGPAHRLVSGPRYASPYARVERAARSPYEIVVVATVQDPCDREALACRVPEGEGAMHDSHALEPHGGVDGERSPTPRAGVDLSVAAPLAIVHVIGLGAAPFTFSWAGLAGCALMYVVTGLGVTAGAHRLFTHRSFQASPILREALALAFLLSAQGSLRRWVRDHAIHHRYSDLDGDPHSPRNGGFWFSHLTWLWKKPPSDADDRALYRKWTKGMEPGRIGGWGRSAARLTTLHLSAVVVAYVVGALVEVGPRADALWSGFDGGLSMVVWAVALRIVLVMHATFLVNSAAHRWGGRPHDTGDDSRNNAFVAFVALGEGWHNNHHHRPAAANNGFHRVWEIDFTFVVLVVLGAFGLLSGLKVYRGGRTEVWFEKPVWAKLFDALAMKTFPWVAGLAGYRFRVGTDQQLRDDGRAVARAAWAAQGVTPSVDATHVGARYDEATTWIVAYHRGVPVGVMGLLDMRHGSIALDLSRRDPPPELDLATTREICRLAILPGHRRRGKLVMVGLLREMLAWSVDNRVERLFSGSTEALFRIYRRYNPTARLLDPPPSTSPEDPEKARYFSSYRAWGGMGVLYTFDVAGASPWDVFSRFLRRRLR